MKIFENGLLKKEFTNPNYRGLVGWYSDVEGYDSSDKYSGKLFAIQDGDSFYHEMLEENEVYTVKIPQFTEKNIPIGELCWYKHVMYPEWCLMVLTDKMVEIFHDEMCELVPYLIAETKEKAEELKDWHL